MNYAIILSGGIGSRMKSSALPKQYIEVNDKPILIYTLEKFENCGSVDSIVVVAAEEWQEKVKGWVERYNINKFAAFAEPGVQRQGSILHGLRKCMEFRPTDEDVVIIHDAARPMVSDELIASCIENARIYGGCMPVIGIADTVYQSLDGQNITGLLDRNTLFAGQSPEAFRLTRYAELNAMVSEEELNAYKGTSEIAYRYGMVVHLIPGDDRNYKITTPNDLERFINYCNELKDERK